MANDIGGGQRGEGGALADANDTLPTDPNANRAQIDYSIPRPITTRELGNLTEPSTAVEEIEEDASAPVRQYLFVSEEEDRILCRRLKDGSTFQDGSDPLDVLISKPHTARRSIWEDEEINGISYVYPVEENHSLRIATRVGEDPEKNPPVYQRWVPPYIPDFSIIYAVEVEDGTEVGATTLIDMNVDGRAWAVERPLTEEEQEA